MQLKLRLLVMTTAVVFFSFVTSSAFGQAETLPTAPSLTSDKNDYAPGEIVTLTGTGFLASEEVELQVVHVGDDPDGTDPEHHEHWHAIADGNGNFVATWTVPTDGDALGAEFKATADGHTSGLHAETFFTDGL